MTMLFKTKHSLKDCTAKKRRLSRGFIAAMAIFMAGVFAFAPACAGGNTTEQTGGAQDGGAQGGGAQGGDSSSQNRYCDILTDIINDPYYDQVNADYGDDGILKGQNAEAPIPYAFLEREGYDVDAIKNDQLSCESVAYIIGDDTSKLYLSVKAETSAGYYGNYVLSYPLTEKEYEDFYMLHDEMYIEAAFFVQELDKQKRATVESHVNVDTKTLEDLEYVVGLYCDDYIYNKNVKIDFISTDQERKFVLNVRTVDKSNKEMISKNKELHTAKCSIGLAYYQYTNGVIKITSTSSLSIYNLEEFKNNYQSITLFDSQGKTYYVSDALYE